MDTVEITREICWQMKQDDDDDDDEDSPGQVLQSQ
jgi:hypothetical protein